MNNFLPRIALPEPTSTDPAYNQRSLPQYIHAIVAAGGVAIPIPLAASVASQKALAASCAAILLPGSPADIDPHRYGSERVGACAAADVARESTDNLLLQDAFSLGKPVFGVCFGLQSLNVWKGGSLVQDLPQAPGAVVDHQPGRQVQKAHTVELTDGSRMAQIFAGDSSGSKEVNSSHHQALERTGRGLRVVARSPLDGIAEAVEGTEGAQFVLAVQWHPERSYDESSFSRLLFGAFLQAARSWKPAATP